MGDPIIRRVTKKIFPYLWDRHKLTSSTPSCNIIPDTEIAFFSNEIGNAAIVYLHMYRPSLSKYLEKHIPSMPHSKMQFWTHVSFLCLQVRLGKDNVFDYFLTTCSITAEVALHCYINGYEDVLPLASVFLCAFFENELYAGFHEAGGWAELRRYIKDTSCHVLYDMVNGYLEDLGSPCENLPIMITAENEHLAAERREIFVSLLSFKIGEIERDDPTKSIVTGLFHWDFIENQRISEVKPGALKRMENIRHKKKKPKISTSEKSSEADEAPEADVNTDEFSCFSDEAQEFVVAIPKTQSKDKDVQMLGNSRSMENKDKLFANNEASDDKPKINSSSSLRELCQFYENLSASSERKADGYKHFTSSYKKQNGLKSSFKEMINGVEKASNFERYPKFVPYSSKNGKSRPKKKIVKPKAVAKSAESFRSDDVLSELTKSFQEVGFTCLCVGNSTNFSDESSSFTNRAEILEKCRYFQNKYYPLQFAVLVPNDYSKDKSTHSPEKENETFFEKQYSDQHTKDVNIQNQSKDESIRKEKPKNETTKISRFTVTKINENQSEDGVCILEKSQTKKTRFTVTKVNENQSKDGTSTFGQSRTNETSKISRFTVTKVNENQSKDGAGILGQNRTNATSKISRFTVTKVNENQSKDGAGILGQNRTNETIKISRFTVTKVNENQSKDGTSILRQNWTSETNTKTARQIDDNQLRLRKSFPSYKTKVPQLANVKFDGSLISLNEPSSSTSSQESDDTKNETKQFQDNGNVNNEKRVSFAKHAFISYYQTYSSDESSNSVNSKESLSQNSAEASNSGHQEDTLEASTPKNKIKEKRGFFRRHSFSGSQSSSSKTENTNKSFDFGFLGRIFKKSSSGNSEASESSKEEMNEQKTEKNEESI